MTYPRFKVTFIAEVREELEPGQSHLVELAGHTKVMVESFVDIKVIGEPLVEEVGPAAVPDWTTK